MSGFSRSKNRGPIQVLANLRKQKLDTERLVQNSTLFIAAGSETTATLLTATTYFLLTNPAYYEKVVSEVRSSFSDETEITLVSVSKLSWMLACLKESNRVFPVVPSWLPRRLVKGNAVIAGDVVPQGVSIPRPRKYSLDIPIIRLKSLSDVFF